MPDGSRSTGPASEGSRVVAAARGAGEHPLARGLVGEHDRRPQQGGASRRRRGGTGALPAVGADVMVVAAGAEERCGGAELRHQSEAEDVAVEADALDDVGDLEVDVADHGAGGDRLERLGGRIVELAEQAARVERQRRHPLGDEPLPALAGAVPVDLDPVAVGVGQVDRLADEVVAEADELDPLASRVGEPAREVDSLGNEQREVIEAGREGRRPPAGDLGEDHELLASRPEAGAAGALGGDPQPDDVAIEGERSLEVGDRQLDRSHRRSGGDPGEGGSTAGLELLGIARAHVLPPPALRPGR